MFLSYLIERKNIFKSACIAAVLFNIDKIVLLKHSPIRVHDSFDSIFPLVSCVAGNFTNYGPVSQIPQTLCGIPVVGAQVLLSYVVSQLFFNSYASYLLHSLSAIFIAFSGMYLLLHDESELSCEASTVGSLFFCGIGIFLPWDLTIAGIPLLLWSLEKVFDDRRSFLRRLVCYLFIIFYYISSSFVIIACALIPFCFSYFLLLSKVKKCAKTVVLYLSVWSLYLIFNLPQLMQLIIESKTCHRNSMYYYGPSYPFVGALKHFVTEISNIDMTGWYITMPSLLGLLLLMYYLPFAGEKNRCRKFFIFVITWIAVIEVFALFVLNIHLWRVLYERAGIFSSLQIDRFHLLLAMLFSMLNASTCDFVIRQKAVAVTRPMIVPAFFVCAYVSMYLYLRSSRSYLDFYPGQLFLQMLSVLVFLIMLGARRKRQRIFSIASILMVSYLLFSASNSLYSRFRYGRDSYHHYFESKRIDAVMRMEKDNMYDFRVVSLGGANPAQLLNNGFHCADGYASIYPQSYKEFWGKVIEPELSSSKRYYNYYYGFGSRAYLFDSLNTGAAIRALTFNNNLLKLIGVKYLFSDKKILGCDRYGMGEIMGKDVQYGDAPGLAQYFREKDYFVYRNKEFAEPAFLTGSIKIFESKRDLLSELGRREYNYLRVNTFVCGDEMEGLREKVLDIRDSRIVNYRSQPDRVVISLINKYTVVLNWTRNYNTSWRCIIDGKERKIFRAYNSFMGVMVPANSRIVEFTYDNSLMKGLCCMSFACFIVVSMIHIRYMWRAGAAAV